VRDRLDILCLSPFPASPPTFGAQRRIAGLMQALARRHRITGLALQDGGDPGAAEQAMRAYCDDVLLVRSRGARGASKRLAQLRALVSPLSYERQHVSIPPLRRALAELLGRRRFDVVEVEFPFFCHLPLRRSPAGTPPPVVLLDQHNVEHDLARQSRDASGGFFRRLHHSANWRKLLREEVAAWQDADGVVFTSRDDEARARALTPSIRAAVVPNAVDVEHFRPDGHLPPPDGRTVVFFGTMNYFPNLDAMRWFLADVWPLVARAHQRARLQIIGSHPSPDVLRHQGPRVEVSGLVDDLRPHLSRAALVIVPLRLGGGTRFKILEAMAMGKAIVSTTLGAEGLGARHERELLLADEPQALAGAIVRLLDDPGLAERLGAAGRTLVEGSYSWTAAGDGLERFLRDLLERARPPGRSA